MCRCNSFPDLTEMGLRTLDSSPAMLQRDKQLYLFRIRWPLPPSEQHLAETEDVKWKKSLIMFGQT